MDSVDAATIVVPNVNTNTAGTVQVFTPFGNGTDTGFTFQQLVSASHLASIPNGAQISGIAYRLSNREASVTTASTYSQFDVQIGKLATSFNTPSAAFADNLGTDTIVARTGPLTIAANSFGPGSPTGPFVEIAFTSPYTYMGGNLAITIRDTLSAPNRIGLDALFANSISGVGGTVSTTSGFNSSIATVGVVNTVNFPVVEFIFVPEPAVFGLVSVATFMALGRCREIL